MTWLQFDDNTDCLFREPTLICSH